jgi:AhpD family alkylhydroperoxidase
MNRARIPNPAMIVPEALPALYALGAVVKKSPVPARTLELVHLRASQINGCAVCVDLAVRELEKAGESDERIHLVAVWREAPCYTDSERAALALGEAATRLSDRGDAVGDAVWEDAARHFDQPALASLVMNIALINFWNRLNATTRQAAGSVPADAIPRP